jgi:hypothetical protein
LSRQPRLVDRSAVLVENGDNPVKKLVLAAMIAAFGAAVILPTVGPDSAYAQTKKKDTKKKKKPMGKAPGKM